MCSCLPFPLSKLFHRIFFHIKFHFRQRTSRMPSPRSVHRLRRPCPSPVRYLDTTSKDIFGGEYNVALGRKIGSGYSATVNKCYYGSSSDPRDQLVMAVKVMVKEKPKMVAMAVSEIALLRKCQDSNVVRFENAVQCRDAFIIFTEYCSRGDMFSNLKHLGDSNLLREYMQGVVKGLMSVHDKLVAHCDIKMKNILITDTNVVKLADFGFAVQLSSDEDHIKVCNGTQDYWSPEMHARPACFNPFYADVYALGVTFVGMCEQRAIKRKHDNIHHIVRNYPDFHQRELFLGMLETNPTERWTLSKVLGSEWINDVTPPPSPT